MTMLRLNPTTLSQAFGQQLIDEGAYLRPSFENKLLPVICDRLNDPTLQRADSGSIGVGSALSLFLAAAKRKPKFIVEVGNYYRVQSEEYGRTPYEEHGHKNFPDCHEEAGNSWNEEDWNEYFRYVFKCIALYLSKGLPIGGESDYYLRAKLVKEIGSEEILQYLIDKLESYEVGKEYFNDALYKELHEEFPNDLENISGNKIWNWVKSVGKFIKVYPNKSVGGKVVQQRLDKERWQDWVDAGMEHHKDRNGKSKVEGERTYVFKISRPTSPESMFATTPNFSNSSPEAEEIPATKPRKSIKKKAVKKQETEVPDKDVNGLEQFLS